MSHITHLGRATGPSSQPLILQPCPFWCCPLLDVSNLSALQSLPFLGWIAEE